MCAMNSIKQVGIPASSTAVAISLLFPADKMVFPSRRVEESHELNFIDF